MLRTDQWHDIAAEIRSICGGEVAEGPLELPTAFLLLGHAGERRLLLNQYSCVGDVDLHERQLVRS